MMVIPDDDPDADAMQENLPARRNERLSSSALTHAEWDRETQTLTVTFVNGQSYSYGDVSEDEFDALVNSSSPGRYWNSYLKGR